LLAQVVFTRRTTKQFLLPVESNASMNFARKLLPLALLGSTDHGRYPNRSSAQEGPQAVIARRDYTDSRRVPMGFAKLIAIYVPLSIAIVLPMMLWGERSKAAEQKARARRMAEHRMNARLLRFNL
jgi:hypothetical protein